MDFKLTEFQNSIVGEAISFAQKQVPADDDTIKREHHPSVDDFGAFLSACTDAGYAGLMLPKAFGGRGLTLVDTMLMFESMACEGVDIGFLFGLGVHQFAAAAAIVEAGSPQQHDQWLRKMAAGACIGALAISEANAGSDSYAMSARAVESENGFVITGEKLWISNAPVAGVFLFCARTDDIPGAFGITCFLVPADAGGVRVSEGPVKAGIRGAPWGSVTLDNVSVPAGDILGGRGGGAAVFQHSMRVERCGLFAIALGAMTKNFQDTLSHVRTREQFGQPLVENDIVACDIGLMKTRMESVRLLLYKAASTIDERAPDDSLICLAKAAVSEAAIDNALCSQKLFGARGVLDDSAASRFLNDILPFRVLSGPNDLQYKIASRLLARAVE